MHRTQSAKQKNKNGGLPELFCIFAPIFAGQDSNGLGWCAGARYYDGAVGTGMTHMLNLSQDVKILAGYCGFMRSIFLHNRILFEESTSEQKEMMSRVAGIFFGDLSSMLRENIILQVCKITDPAKDARGNDNQTIDFLLQHLKVEPATMQRLTELNGKLQDFRRKILPARNKLISHLDRDAIRAGAPLGGVPDSEWNEFWSNLQDLVCIIYDKVVGERFYINTTRSDADGLLKALKNGALSC